MTNSKIDNSLSDIIRGNKSEEDIEFTLDIFEGSSKPKHIPNT